GSRDGDAAPPGALRFADSARERGHGTRGFRPPQQAGWRRARHQRDHREGASGPGDAENEGRFTRRLGKDRSKTPSPNFAAALLSDAKNGGALQTKPQQVAGDITKTRGRIFTNRPHRASGSARFSVFDNGG